MITMTDVFSVKLHIVLQKLNSLTSLHKISV